MNTRAVLWDCDGTLVDSEFLAMGIALEAAHSYLNPTTTYPPHLISQLSGRSFQQICDYVAQEHSQPLPHYIYDTLNHRQLEDTIRVLAAEVEPTPGTLEQLEAIQLKSLILAVVTSSSLARVNPCLDRVLNADHLSLRKFFPPERVFSAEDPNIFPDGPRNKPDPSIYQYAVQTLGLKPEECVALEDSASGVKAAVRAKIPVIGYIGGRHIDQTPAGLAKKKAALIEAAQDPGDSALPTPILIIQTMSQLPLALEAVGKARSRTEIPVIFSRLEKHAPPKPFQGEISQEIDPALLASSRNPYSKS